MENKVELLNRLATITDLIERLGINSLNNSVSFDLNTKEFDGLYDSLGSNNARRTERPKDRFKVDIGGVEFFFNKNSV
jgi:hypothetical protein